MQLYEAGIMQKLLKKKFFEAILLTLPILIVLQDVSYALSPTSRFRPITDVTDGDGPNSSSTALENEAVPVSPRNFIDEIAKSKKTFTLPSIVSEQPGAVVFMPKRDFIQGRPLDTTIIRTTRSAEEAREILKNMPKRTELYIRGYLRSVDGPGSSLDLPEFQVKLTPQGNINIEEVPSTPTLASEFSVTVRFELLPDEKDRDVIEYVASDYGINPDNPYRVEGGIRLNPATKDTPWETTPKGQLDAPAYIFRNIFGLGGIRIICLDTDAMALAGGMESSNVFNVALIAAASMLSGANLSQAEIFNLAVKLENNEFKGLTGGQGHLCCMLGGAWRHIWLSGMTDDSGKLVNPYSALSVPFLSEEHFDAIEDHMFIVQAGKEYESGRPRIKRTAALINYMWTDLLRYGDPEGVNLHRQKIALSARYTKALQDGNFEAAVTAVNRYVDIRDALCRRWLGLVIDYHLGRDVPDYVKAYFAPKVFDKSNEYYEFYDVVRDVIKNMDACKKTGKTGYEESARSISFYTYEGIGALIKEARKEGIAIMPLGAGGPGANLIALSPNGSGHLRKFLESQGIEQFTPEKAEKAKKLIRGLTPSGEMKGYMPFKIGREPLQINGFDHLEGVRLPEGPIPLERNEDGPDLSSADSLTKNVSKENRTVPITETKNVSKENRTVPITENLTEINGVPIQEIERRARPGVYAETGFLGRNEGFIEVLKNDDRIVKQLGTTHQELAKHLRNIIAMGDDFDLKGAIYNGQRISVFSSSFAGTQKSLFKNELRKYEKNPENSSWGSTYYVKNLDNGLGIVVGRGVIGYIERYGFYEGGGIYNPYRIDPRVLHGVITGEVLPELSPSIIKVISRYKESYFINELKNINYEVWAESNTGMFEDIYRSHIFVIYIIEYPVEKVGKIEAAMFAKTIKSLDPKLPVLFLVNKNSTHEAPQGIENIYYFDNLDDKNEVLKIKRYAEELIKKRCSASSSIKAELLDSANSGPTLYSSAPQVSNRDVPNLSSAALPIENVSKEIEPVPISPPMKNNSRQDHLSPKDVISEKLKAALERYNNPDAKAPPDFSEGQNLIHQILFAAKELPEAEEIKEEAAHVLAKWVLKLLEALAGQIKKMCEAENFEGIIKEIGEKFLSQPIIKQIWNEEYRLPLFKEFEPETGNHFLAHIRGGPLNRIYMYAQLIREVGSTDKKYSKYKEKIREAIEDTERSLGQFRDKLAESLYKKKGEKWDGSDLSPALPIENVSKENEPVPFSPAAPAHVETTKLAVELKDIKENLREKLFAMEAAREALVQILDEIIKEGLFPSDFVIRNSSKESKAILIKKLHSKLTRANSPENQKAIIGKVNFTMEAVRRIILGMQNKIKDDEMKDILGMQRRYDEIINKLAKESEGLVWTIVKSYCYKLGKEWRGTKGLSVDLFQNDLFQVGNMALIEATERFDPRQGTKFSTYATTAITRKIQTELRQRLVAIPDHLWEENAKIIEFSANFTQTKEREPTVWEVARGLKLPVFRIKEILRVFKNSSSLDEHFGEDGEESPLLLLEYSLGRKMKSPSEGTDSISDELMQALWNLDEREKEIIKSRYGLGGDGERTLEEIGKILEISRERVRQIERIALNKLRFYLRPKGDSPPSHKREKGEKGDDPDLSPADLPIEDVSKENRTVPFFSRASLKSVAAVDSRDLKPFFEKHELGFQNRVTVTVAARELNGLIIDKNAREGAIYVKIGKLNKTFPNGEIEIEKNIKTDTFQCSGKEYKYAIFNFKKEDKTINVLFLKDHAALTSDELAELGIQDIEKRHLDCPGLEGVWFINPAAILKQTGSEPPAMSTAAPAVETMHQPRIGGAREPVLEREAIQKKIDLLEDTKKKLENNEFPAIINFGDKHGVADDLERILQAAQKADRDGKRLVIIGHGDAFDRGNQSFRNFEILQELKNITERNPNISVYLCFGNHDVLVIQALLLNNETAHDVWLKQGGRQVLDEFNARGVDTRSMAIWMLKNLKIFHIDEMDFLHLHAGIPMDKNGNPLISMKQLKAWQYDLDSVKQALNQDPAFLDSESNRLRLTKLFDEAEDIFWVRQDGWIANLMDGGEAARIRIDERNKAELFSLLEESIKAIMPSISKAQIEEQIKENWARILIRFEKQFKMAGIEFKVSGQESKINKDKLDRFLAQLGVNGVVFGHIHAGELINIDNRMFCVDVYDVNGGDEGHLIFNGEGIKFNAMRQGEYLIAAPAIMIADIDAQIIRLKKRLVKGAAQEEAAEVLRKIVEGMELGIMPTIASKETRHLNVGDVVISAHTGTRRKVLSVDNATGIVQVERTDTSGKVDRDEMDIADIVKAVRKGIARIEPVFIKEIAETRQAAIVEMLNTPEEKNNDVKVVVGVPIDMNKANVQPALSAINRGLAKNGFGRMEDNKQVITFEIDKIDTVKTAHNQERAMQKAREELAPNGRVVLFAPQMEMGPQLAGKAQEAYKDQSNITVVPDAYTDSAPEQNVFPDIMVRVALGRNIAFYYTGKDPQGTLASINDILAKVADGLAPIITVDDLLNILKPLRIRPVYYNAITDWQRAQEAVAASL